MKIKLTYFLFFLRKKLLPIIMRAFIFLFCTTVFSLTPDNVLSQNAKILIDSDKTISVDEVFDLIMSQTDYTFIYHINMFENFPKVNLKKGVVKVSQLLEKSLSNKVFNLNFTDNNTIVIKKVKIPFQEINISGQVVDQNGIPIPGATVYVTNNKPSGERINQDFLVRGTATDIDGNFSLLGEVGYFIVVTGLGYEYLFQEVTENKTVYNITLKEKASALNEVVVIGYGTTTKKDLTGSVGTIKATDIEQIKTQTVENALYGKIPGVFVQSAGSRPGATSSVVIRGLSQINGDNQPLYVVDNVPINITANSSTRDGLLTNSPFAGTRSNPLLSINPADIETVSILKDASAAAIYGSRAANGVIIITTKRGKRGEKPRFTFSTNATFQNPRAKYEFLSKEEFKNFYNPDRALEFLTSTGVPEFLWANIFPNPTAIINTPETFFGDADTNWQDEITNRNALWTDYRIGVSGGSEKSNYALSASAQDQDAILIGGNFKRYTLAANIDANVTDKIKIGGSINYSHSIDKSSAINNLQNYGNYRPDFPVRDENGNFTSSQNLFGVLPLLNPIGSEARIPNKTVSNNVFGSLYGEVEIVKNLKFRSTFSASLSNDKVDNFLPSFTRQALFEGFNSQLISFGEPSIGILTTQHNNSHSLTFQNTLNYNTTIAEDHNINALVGLSWDRSKNEAQGTSFAGFPDDFVLINPASALTTYNGNSDHAQKGLNSFMARANYKYKDKYLATLTGRVDRSTQFGQDNSTGFFPAAAVAWNIHNEGFLKNSNNISQLKLRASIGKTGNDNLPAFLFAPRFATEGGIASTSTEYNGLKGTRLQGIPNPELRWEETDQIDVALELGLFNNRLNAEITWFDKKTSDLILLVPTSAQTGFLNYRANIADVSNNGWEFQIGGDVIRTQDFNWNSSFNVSFIKNNVDALKGGQSDNTTFAGDDLGVVEGYPLGTRIGAEVIGIAQNQQQIDDLNASAGGQYSQYLLAPGDYIFRDIDGDGKYTDEKDRTPLADGNEANFFGGWNNTINYKDFDFSFNFQFVQGLDKIRSTDQFLNNLEFNQLPNLIANDANNTWTQENQNAKYARAGSRSLGQTNSRMVSDASYISLRSASIAYNLPSSVLTKIGLSNAKLTLSGNNLFLIHNYDGIDPESSELTVGQLTSLENATDRNFSYPQARTFTLGLNVTF